MTNNDRINLRAKEVMGKYDEVEVEFLNRKSEVRLRKIVGNFHNLKIKKYMFMSKEMLRAEFDRLNMILIDDTCGHYECEDIMDRMELVVFFLMADGVISRDHFEDVIDSVNEKISIIDGLDEKKTPVELFIRKSPISIRCAKIIRSSGMMFVEDIVARDFLRISNGNARPHGDMLWREFISAKELYKNN